MESLHYLLMKSHSLVSKAVLNEATELGLTSGQPKILDFLLAHQEAEQKTIAAYCQIERATVGSILLRMEEAGLILRRQKNGNRRSLYVSLTEKGKDTAVRLTDIFRNVEQAAVKTLSEAEQGQLKMYLCRICDAMKESGK